MKSQDIFILLKLVSLEQDCTANPPAEAELRERYSMRGLAATTGVSKTEVNASIRRSINVGLAIKDRKTGLPKVNRKSLCDFVRHGLKFVFPAKAAEMVRGIPTTFFAPMLQESLRSAGDYIYVWPYAKGQDQGQAVQPLFKSVPEAALEDERLYEYLALLDSMRLGRPREANLAAKLFEERIKSNV